MEQLKNNNIKIMRFARENMGATASFVIALCSKDLIYSFVNDLVMPLINKNLFTLTADKINIKNLFVNLITWVLVLINTYLFYSLFIVE
jgi:large-conductance mechanosensitive channel